MRVQLEHITKEYDELTAVDDLSISIEDGEFLTLVGPSGCGKTTTLRCIAGLNFPTDGTIRFGDRDVTNLPAQQRNIAFVFQNYALYPHMTARRNISFALEDAGMDKEAVAEKIEAAAEMLGIADHLDKKPKNLSGGQQQRVALGRSIVRDPDIFLFDEPLSNLDAKLRVQMRSELQKLHNELGATMIYVTHDQEEAMTLSDRVAIMNHGKLQQIGPPEEVYNRPANQFVGGFMGSPSMNFFDATFSNDRIESEVFTFDAPANVSGDVATLGIRPEDLYVSSEETNSGVEAEVRVFEQIGSTNVVYLDVGGYDDDVIAEIDPSLRFDPGDTLILSLEEERVHLFDSEGDSLYNPPLYSDQMSPGVGPHTA